VVTVDDALVTDVDAVDPPNAGTGITSFSFTTVNDNAPSVSTAQVEVVNVFTNLPLGPGAFADADTDLRLTFSENVTVAGNWASLTCTSSGTQSVSAGLAVTAADPVFTLNPATNLTAGENCTLTVFAAQVIDDDATDPPDNMAVDAVFSFTVRDVAPRVLAPTVPLAAAVVPNTQVVTLNFSEVVDLAAASVSFNCGAAVAFTPTLPLNNVSSVTLTPSAPLPNGAACTVTLESTLITDVDATDPPNELDGDGSLDIVDGDADDFSLSFTVDQQPSVTLAQVEVSNVFTALPLGAGTFADLDTDLRLTFSEAVNPTGNWASLTCTSSGTQSVSAGLAVTAADPVFTLNPATNLTPSESCTLTVFAAQINDDDAIDPPNGLAADAVFTFTVRDTPPQVVAPTIPLNAATVSNNQVVTFNFSEAVDLAAASIVFNCGGAVAFTPALPQNNVSTITLTPSAALPSGACTVTLESTLITDVDAVDPPNQLDGNNSNDIVEGDADDFVLDFTVDAAPTVVSTTPADLAVNVLPTSNISIDFSESVTFSTATEVAAGDNPSFDLVCNGVPTAFSVVSTSPNDPVVINPVDNAVAGRSCVLTVRSGAPGLVADADTFDPPNFLVADFTATIGFGSDAVNDAYTVTRQLTFNAPAAVEADANDIMGLGTITGFGIAAGSANANAPGALVDDGVNGAFRLNADGTFSFFPPANPATASTDFFYTVSGGDSASITFTYATAPAAELELVWFVNVVPSSPVCTAGNANLGTQACPVTTLTAAAGLDTPNDTLYMFLGSYNGNVTLETGERVIGNASGSNLAAITGITPVTGSAFPAFTGLAPTVSCAAAAGCIALPAAGNNTLRGFIIGDSGATGSDISGTTFGTLTVGEMTLNGTGRALNLITGTLNGNFIDIDAASGSNQGIRLDAVGGIWSVTNQVNIGNVGATGFNITNAPAGASATLTGGLLVNKTAAGAAVFLQTNNAGATINLGVISLTTGASAGLSVTTSPVTLTGTTGTINATGGPAIDASTATFVGGATLATVSSTGSGSTGINLNGVTGTLTMNAGAIATATGNDFDVNAGAASITYAGTITNTAGRSVEVTGHTGGTVLLSGSISDTGTGVNLTGNTGGTITFNGGLVVSTGTNSAFNATGGGTVNVCDESACNGGTTGTLVNTLTTTTGSALNVANTTIGAGNLEFRSISSNGGTGVGISLDTTGSSGGLKVVGDGTNVAVGGNSTGGTIANKAGTDGNTTDGIGIYLNNTSNVILRRITINGTNQNFGIRGFRVNNFTLEYSTVNGTNGTSPAFDNYGEGGVMFGDDATVNTNGMTGVGTVTNSSFSGGLARNFSVVNTAGTLNRLTITGSFFGHNGNGNASLAVEARNALTVANVTVTGSTFTGSPGDAGNFTGQTGTTMDVIFGGVTAVRGTAPGNTITNNHPNNNIGGSNLTFASQGVMNFHCMGNTMRDANGSAVTFFKANAGTVLNGFFDNNEIGNSAVVNSGSASGNGIFVSAGGTGTMSYTITNNLIHRIAGNGHIYADNTGGSYTANFTIQGNTFDTPGATEAFAIGMTNGSPMSTDTVNVCAVIGGSTAAQRNTINFNPTVGIVVGSSGANGGHTFRLPGLGASNEAAVEAFIQGNNTGAFTTDAYADAPATFAAFIGTGTNCGTPSSEAEQ
jgi:hypothetical protein